jgi:hypothetical protein
MKNVRRFALAMAGLATFLGTPVAAASWVYVGENSNGAVIYYDADTIQRSGDQITVWTKWNHSRNRTVRYREAKNRDRFDCEERTITLIAYTNYYPDGKVETFNIPTYGQEDDPVTPESIGETILETVCAATAP